MVCNLNRTMSGDLDQFDPRFFQDYEEEQTSEFLSKCQYDWKNIINDDLLNDAYEEAGTNLPGMLLFLANYVIREHTPCCLPMRNFSWKDMLYEESAEDKRDGKK